MRDEAFFKPLRAEEVAGPAVFGGSKTERRLISVNTHSEQVSTHQILGSTSKDSGSMTLPWKMKPGGAVQPAALMHSITVKSSRFALRFLQRCRS